MSIFNKYNLIDINKILLLSCLTLFVYCQKKNNVEKPKNNVLENCISDRVGTFEEFFRSIGSGVLLKVEYPSSWEHADKSYTLSLKLKNAVVKSFYNKRKRIEKEFSVTFVDLSAPLNTKTGGYLNHKTDLINKFHKIEIGKERYINENNKSADYLSEKDVLRRVFPKNKKVLSEGTHNIGYITYNWIKCFSDAGEKKNGTKSTYSYFQYYRNSNVLVIIKGSIIGDTNNSVLRNCFNNSITLFNKMTKDLEIFMVTSKRNKASAWTALKNSNAKSILKKVYKEDIKTKYKDISFRVNICFLINEDGNVIYCKGHNFISYKTKLSERGINKIKSKIVDIAKTIDFGKIDYSYDVTFIDIPLLFGDL